MGTTDHFYDVENYQWSPPKKCAETAVVHNSYMINNKRIEGAKAEKLKKNRKCFRIVKKGFEVMKSF